MTDGSMTPVTVPDTASVGSDTSATSDPHRWTGDSLYQHTSNAAAEGAAVVVGLQSGLYATFDACVAVAEALDRFQGDHLAITAFMRPMAEVNIFSEQEARLGRDSPKLSRLGTVGRCADQLRQPALANYFLEIDSWGYSLLHQATVLLGQMPKGLTDDERALGVVEKLRQEGVTTRLGMIQLTKKLKNAKRDPDANRLPARAPTAASAIAGSTIAVEETPDTQPAEAARCFDLIVATPKRFDNSRLRDPREESLLPRCLCVAARGDVADDAVMIVMTRLSDVTTIEDRILPYCGFEGVRPRVFLLSRPAGSEVTDVQVLVVVERGSSDRVRWETIRWFADNEQVDPLAFAEELVPNANSKLQLFATSETDGWHAIVGDDNWSVADE
jgi:hypothetical protein